MTDCEFHCVLYFAKEAVLREKGGDSLMADYHANLMEEYQRRFRTYDSVSPEKPADHARECCCLACVPLYGPQD